VVVVDGGSTDGTVEIAKALRPTALIFQQPRQGKGDALIAGFLATSGDIIVTLDADGSQKVDEIPRFVSALRSGADFAKGSRLVAGGGSADLTWIRAAGNRGLGIAANLMHGTSYTDLTYGYNAFWRHCLTHIVSEADGFEGEIIMYIRAARAGLRITEVPCYEERRIFGESNLRTFRDGWRILRMLVSERRYPAAAAGLAAQGAVTAAREGL
jgi:glycosyltransferase involved in cell wall biosynthesis